MIRLIAAATLRDALSALAEKVAGYERGEERNIVFCEDRLTLLAERAVLSRTGATMRTEVTSFARFLSGGGKVLSKQGSVMAISSILSSLGENLHVFGRSSARSVYETLAQLSASRVDAEALRRASEESEGLLKNKLSDLALIGERYSDFLRERGLLDENGYLSLLPARIAEELKGANIFFFAFSSFTRQAAEGIRAAFLASADTVGIFVGGGEEIYTNEAYGIFRHAAEEFGGCARSSAPCSLGGDALVLRDALFAPETFSRPKIRAERVRFFTAPDETREIERVCALIRKHVAEEGMRYRDFAVLVAGKEGFLTAERVFSAYSVPFYADRKKPYSEHPFCVFLSDVFAAASDGGTGDSVDAIASSPYFGESGNYRNYLLRYGGYRGAVNKEIKDGDAVKGYGEREALVACRGKMRKILSFLPRKGTGREFSEACRRLADFAEAERVTEEISKESGETEREFLALKRLYDALDEIAEVAGGDMFSAREFSAVLFNGLEAAEVSVLPRKSDAVFLGDATESRLSECEVLFCTGLTDALPPVSQDTAVITDGEIERLSRIKVRVEPAIAVVNARARESLALNMCAFKRALYLSCPARCGGKEARRSEALGYALRAMDPAPMPEVFPYDCCEREPAVLAMLRYKENFLSGKRSGNTPDGEKFAAVRSALCKEGEARLVSDLLSGGEKGRVGALNELLLGGEISPTLLESYFECPYAGFALRGLRLREREERTVLASDAGVFVHTALERITPRFDGFGSESDCLAFAEQTARELLASPRFSSLLDTKEGEYTGERLVRECVAIARAAYEKLIRSQFRAEQTEEEIVLPALSLRGRADRVDRSDEYVRVIDYKTGYIDDAATAYYTGRKLQLELYLLGASEGGVPAGAFYFPAADAFSKEGEEKFGMRGFASASEEVVRRMGEEIGRKSDKRMQQGAFNDFLSYALLVAQNARKEMGEGNIAPSPYDGACERCKLKGMCAFTGEERKEPAVKCAEIAAIAARAKSEQEDPPETQTEEKSGKEGTPEARTKEVKE